MVEIWKRNSLIAYFCIFPSGPEYNTPKRPVWSIKKRSREQLWFKDFFASQRLTIKWTTIWYLLRGGEGPGGQAEEAGTEQSVQLWEKGHLGEGENNQKMVGDEL